MISEKGCHCLLHDKAAEKILTLPLWRQRSTNLSAWSSNSWVSWTDTLRNHHLSWSFPLPGFLSTLHTGKPVMWLMQFSKPVGGLTKNEWTRAVSLWTTVLLLSSVWPDYFQANFSTFVASSFVLGSSASAFAAASFDHFELRQQALLPLFFLHCKSCSFSRTTW